VEIFIVRTYSCTLMKYYS